MYSSENINRSAEQGNEELSVTATQSSTVVTSKDSSAFSALMGKSVAQLQSQRYMTEGLPQDFQKAMPDSLLRKEFSQALLSNIAPNQHQESLKFSIYFPDGSQAHVLAKNSKRRVDIFVKTDSKSLARGLNNHKAKAEKDLQTHFGKRVAINVL